MIKTQIVHFHCWFKQWQPEFKVLEHKNIETLKKLRFHSQLKFSGLVGCLDCLSGQSVHVSRSEHPCLPVPGVAELAAVHGRPVGQVHQARLATHEENDPAFVSHVGSEIESLPKKYGRLVEVYDAF